MLGHSGCAFRSENSVCFQETLPLKRGQLFAQKHHMQAVNFWNIGAFILFAVVAAFLPGALFIHFPTGLFNADVLVAEGMYRDLFIDGYPITGWKVSNGTSIFPDLPLYFVLRAFSGTTAATAAGYAVTGLAVVAFVWSRIVAALFQIRWDASIASASAGSILIVILFAAQLDGGLLFEFFLPVFHTGSCLTTLIALLLTIRWLDKPSHLVLVGLFINNIVAVISTKLFILSGIVAPVLAILFLRSPIPFGIRIRYAGVSLASLAAGVWILGRIVQYKMIRVVSVDHGVWQRFLERTKGIKSDELWQLPRSMFDTLSNAVNGPLLWFSLLWVSGALLFLFLNGRRLRGATVPKIFRSINADHVAVRFFAAYSVFLFPVLLGGATFTSYAYYGDFFQARYLMFLFVFPVLSVTSFLLHAVGYGRPALRTRILFEKIVPTNALPALFGSIGLAFLLWKFPAQLMRLERLSFTHPLASCIDGYADDFRLHFGLSDYWNAKPVTIFSSKGIRVNQLHYNLDIDYWNSNFNWFLGKGGGTPEYDFLVVERLNESAVIPYYGKPAAILPCPGARIYVYNRAIEDAKFRRQFTRDGLLLWKEITGN